MKVKVISQRLFDLIVILSGLGSFAGALIVCEFLGIQGEGLGALAIGSFVFGGWYVYNRLGKELSAAENQIRAEALGVPRVISEDGKQRINPPQLPPNPGATST